MTPKMYKKILENVGSNEITIITNTIPQKITTLTSNAENFDEGILQIWSEVNNVFTQHYIPFDCVLSITESWELPKEQ